MRFWHLSSKLHECPRYSSKDGYSFFFYSNDHVPMHIHVRYAEGEAVFVVEPTVELREAVGLNVRQLSKAEGLIHDNLELIRLAWAKHLGGSGGEGVA